MRPEDRKKEEGASETQMGSALQSSSRARIDTGKWAYITTTWDLRTGKRKKGRPRHRWALLFKAAVGPEWTQGNGPT